MTAKQTFKQLQADLDVVLEKLQSDEVDIDQALGLHKQGQDIIKQLEVYLKNAQNEIKKINK
ncbi:MAG: exodeoxyribonuclease VII small subunit [Candidatus Saccharimonadales bacterium]